MEKQKIQINPKWQDAPVSQIQGETPLWDFEQLKIVELWTKYGVRGEGVNAYVIDSGVVMHQGFAHHDNLLKLSFMDDQRPIDGNGHGTWCCGKIAAMGVGIAPHCKLVSCRTLDDQGSGYNHYTTDALRWINRQSDPHIINMSLGSFWSDASQADMIKKLWDRGCIPVAAAGNEDTGDLSYPAAYPGCIAVAAIDEGQDRAWFSNYGEHIVIAAPGVACYSTYLKSSYRNLMGTSMASPTVAGLLALGYSWFLKNRPDMTRPEIRDKLISALKDSAIDLGAVGKDDFYGYGGINGPGFMLAVAGY